MQNLDPVLQVIREKTGNVNGTAHGGQECALCIIQLVFVEDILTLTLNEDLWIRFHIFEKKIERCFNVPEQGYRTA